jgi:hypothetical protein
VYKFNFNYIQVYDVTTDVLLSSAIFRLIWETSLIWGSSYECTTLQFQQLRTDNVMLNIAQVEACRMSRRKRRRIRTWKSKSSVRRIAT